MTTAPDPDASDPDASNPDASDPDASDQPRWRRRKQARPEELVQAALALFVEQGFAATRMRDVARRAGVSKGTVYLYFRSKEDLLRAAVRDSVVPILDIGDDMELESDASATALLQQLLREWVDGFEQRGVSGVPKLVMAEAGNFPEIAREYVHNVSQRSRRLFARVLKRGIRSGEFRDFDVHSAVHLLLTPILYALIHRASLAPWDPSPLADPAFLDTHLDFFLRAICAPAEETP